MCDMEKPKIISRTVCSKGSWLRFETIKYSDRRGKVRSWENVSRTNDQGAVVMIASLKSSGSLLLIRQFRPPTGGYVIEFPAGLIDKGETIETTAVRELKEETGYSGVILSKTSATYTSPGLSNETIVFVVMEIDEEDVENENPVAMLEPEEDIQLFKVPKELTRKFLMDREKVGDKIDSKLMSFVLSSEQFTGSRGSS